MKTAIALATVVATVLAGCAGDPSPAADRNLGLQGTGAVVDLTPDLLLRHVGLAEAIHTTVWANGTVAIQDTCNTGACLLDASRALHLTDLTPFIPAGVPTLLNVELDWKSDLGGGNYDAWIEAPDSTAYSSRMDFTPGHLELQTILLPHGTITLVMAAFGPGEDVPSAPYTLYATIDADPVGVPPGVPVVVALAGGDTLRAGTYGGGPSPFLLYGPDDALRGQYSGEHTLADGAPSGNYVVIIPDGSPWGNLTTDSGATEMRALGLHREDGATFDVEPQGAAGRSWDVAGVPVGVGVRAFSDSDLPLTMMASLGLRVAIDGPNGFKVEGVEVCGVCLTS
ncbi:MAG: hypothetical protein QOC71_480, partial [Thermoplasmata archaeon]|nr:hypothetical protein [Thermoplasmata archaeon]